MKTAQKIGMSILATLLTFFQAMAQPNIFNDANNELNNAKTSAKPLLENIFITAFVIGGIGLAIGLFFARDDRKQAFKTGGALLLAGAVLGWIFLRML